MSLVYMYDSVNAASIPDDAPACAGYIDGPYWASYPGMKARFPHIPVMSITVRGTPGARIIDFEGGTVTIGQTISWVNEELRAGRRPTVYTTPDNWEEHIAPVLEAEGVISRVDWWQAEWNGHPDLLPPAVAHQFQGGITVPYDLSVAESTWLGIDVPPPAPPAPPAPSTKGLDEMSAYDPVSGGIWETNAAGELFCSPVGGATAPFIAGLNQHPDYKAGSVESGNLNPCIGIQYWKNDKAKTDGIVYQTLPTKPFAGQKGPYAHYAFRRNGTPD